MVFFIDGEEHTSEGKGDGPVDATVNAIESEVGSGAELVLFSVNAISTGTHGSGLQFGSLSTQVTALRMRVAELEDDPHALLARLREREPVSWLPALAGWLVTRHDLATAVMRDAQGFTVDDPRFSTGQIIGPSMLTRDGGEQNQPAYRALFHMFVGLANAAESFDGNGHTIRYGAGIGEDGLDVRRVAQKYLDPRKRIVIRYKQGSGEALQRTTAFDRVALGAACGLGRCRRRAADRPREYEFTFRRPGG